VKKRVPPQEGEAATTKFIFTLEKANRPQWSHYWWCCRAAGRFSVVASNQAES